MLISAVIDSECERIAGRKNARNPLRTANWWGSQLSPVYYDRQKVLIDRPRLRGVDNKEIPLNTHKEGISKPQEDETGSMERLNPSAAASLKEGLEETLTVHRLGVTGLLRKTLSTTNPVESCFSVTRTITGRVKRWNGGDMVQRWAVAALLRAEKKFKRVKGYREIPKLTDALGQKNLDWKEVAA